MMPGQRPYQYGVRTREGDVERQPDKASAVTVARNWAISPLRTAPRQATVVRRRGFDGPWEEVATWRSPEAQREAVS
jgi:hypothetical protein